MTDLHDHTLLLAIVYCYLQLLTILLVIAQPGPVSLLQSTSVRQQILLNPCDEKYSASGKTISCATVQGEVHLWSDWLTFMIASTPLLTCVRNGVVEGVNSRPHLNHPVILPTQVKQSLFGSLITVG